MKACAVVRREPAASRLAGALTDVLDLGEHRGHHHLLVG
jgi:hypothetical protein